MKPTITIAVDGYAACGKSTLARALARELGYIYIDSGAMYRAVTLYCLRHQIDWNNPQQIQAALEHVHIDFRKVGNAVHTFLNGEDVEAAIRTMEVSQHVSPVSTVSAVRRTLVRCQQAMGEQGGIVMDGRDIGTVVFPNAELKLFMTASIAVRTQRRVDELQAKSSAIISNTEEVQRNLVERDHIDSTRADSPLRQADDALVIDNSNLTPAQQLAIALQLANEQIEQKMAKMAVVD